MQMHRTFDCSPDDYTTNVTWLNTKHYKFNVEWNPDTQQFHFDYIAEESYYTSVLNDLAEMKNEATTFEHKDSLNEAISAIKTLLDMGVIK